MNHSLEAVAVSKSFGGLVALDHVRLSVLSGEIVGLIGPNGSGKTTLLNVMSGVYPASSGQVLLDGEDISGLSMHKRARRGMARTFQQIRLFKDLTVLENVEMGAVLFCKDGSPSVRSIASQAMTAAGVSVDLFRRASTLDYGSQRRLEIARALVLNPSFLLLDEPAAGMNEVESDELLQTMESIRATRAIGILVIDHDLRLIMRLCDRVVVLNQGGVICEGTPDQVQSDPRVTEAYLGREHGLPMASTGGSHEIPAP